MLRNRGIPILIVIMGLFAGTTSLVAQEITGTILGNVKDISGAAVANAAITITNEGTGIKRTVSSDANGDYTVSLLPVGKYTVTVVRQGFSTYVQKGIELHVNQNARVDAALKPGSVQEEVTVAANAAQIETTTATVGKVMEERPITELPLNGRNYLQLGVLQPGVSPITPNLSLSGSGAAADEGFTVNGLRTQANVFLIDGALNTDLFYTSSNLKPPPDAIQEFRILTNDYAPEFWGGGSVVNLVIRSGTNQLHGDLWEFLRNDAVDAQNYFATTHPPLKQNQFGGAVGGPIYIPHLYDGRDKTFFYFYYEGLRVRQGVTSNASVPTVAEVGGDFNGVTPVPIDPSTHMPFPGNMVPVNPISAQLLALYPQSTTGTFSTSPSQTNNENSYGFRIDHHLGNRDTIWGHYLYSGDNQILPFAPFGATVPGFPGSAQITPQTLTVGETHLFSNNVVSDLHLSYVRTNFANPIFTRRDSLSSFGFEYPTTAPTYETIPFIAVSGLSSLGNPQGPGIRITNTFEGREAISVVTGKHNLKFGVDIRNTRYNIIFGSGVNGSYTFNGTFTGNPLADFELGMPSVFTQATVGGGHLHGYTYEGYVQDDFRLRPNLTLNIGVRYTAQTAFADNSNELFGAFRVGQQSTVRPDAPMDLVYQGDPGVPPGTFPRDANNFAPRIGIAWDPTGKGVWSLRAGYGMFYEYVPGIAVFNAAFSSPPGFPSVTINAPSDYANPLVSNPGALAPGSIKTPVSLTSLSPNLHLPYDQQWNLSLQRQLPADMLFEADYIGTKGTGLIMTIPINPAVFGPGATVANTNARRIFAPNFASVNQVTNTGWSKYNGLQLSLNKRFSHGLSFLGSYTWSKSLDNNSFYNISQGTNAGNLNQPEKPSDLSLEKGLSLFDVRNRFVLSATYIAPFGKGLEGFLGAIAKGWETNFVVSLQSGTPFTVYEPVDISLTGVGADRPNVVGDPNAGPRTVQEWFNTAAFQRLNSVTDAGQYGNEPRNEIIGPPYKNVDFSLAKNFPMGERFRLQFRSEFFNVFNHPNFGTPVYTAGSPQFGQILKAADPRIIQFALKLHF